MPHSHEYLAANAKHAERVAARTPDEVLDVVPAKHIAVVACMDARLDVFDALGLARGDAHVIRNAGGVITDDVVRSLATSQRLLHTREIVLVHHTQCGLASRDDEGMREVLRGEGGEEWTADTHVFTDPAESVRESAKALRESPFVPHTEHLRGFVYDVATGLLDEVAL